MPCAISDPLMAIAGLRGTLAHEYRMLGEGYRALYRNLDDVINALESDQLTITDYTILAGRDERVIVEISVRRRHDMAVAASNPRQDTQYTIMARGIHGEGATITFTHHDAFQQSLDGYLQMGYVIVNREQIARAVRPDYSVGFGVNCDDLLFPEIEVRYDIIYTLEQVNYTPRNEPRRREFDGLPNILGTTPLQRSSRTRNETFTCDKAYERAKKLLLDCLTDDEREEAANFGTITIKTEMGLFRVHMDDNIIGPPIYNVHHGHTRYCAVVGDAVYPTPDHILMQVLLLKSDPIKFIETANHEVL